MIVDLTKEEIQWLVIGLNIILYEEFPSIESEEEIKNILSKLDYDSK